MNTILNSVTEDISNQTDEYIKKGLELKGYNFKTRSKMIDFIKNNCRCEDYAHLKQKTFFVNNKPFLIFDYDVNWNYDLQNNCKITAEIGGYKFV